MSEGSLNSVLSVKNYNRSVSCYKIVYEALQRLRFQEFLDDLEEEKEERIMEFLCEKSDSFPERNFRDSVDARCLKKFATSTKTSY